jgi:hypothetical protein
MPPGLSKPTVPVEAEQHLDSATWASVCRECGSHVE